MSQRISISVLVVLMCGSVCFGQSSFKGLTPGQSTRAQVVRVLGQPVNKVSATLIEYRPQSLTGKIVVQYRKGSPVVERIEMLCQQEASTCDDLIKNLDLHLPLTDAAKVKRQGDEWLAYFGSPLLIVMTGDLTRRTPAQVAFYSRELYEATAPEVKDAKEAVVEALAKLDAQPIEPAPSTGVVLNDKAISMPLPSYPANRGLTPGQSTKSDVVEVLGQPVVELSKTLYEYKSDKTTEQIFVQYLPDSDVVARIEFVYATTLERIAVMRALSLQPQPNASQINSKGRLEEYFSAARVVLTYVGPETTSSVRRVGFYSRELFESAVSRIPTDSATPASNSSVNINDAVKAAVQIPVPAPKCRKFDEFPDISRNDEMARLDNFAIELFDPISTAYVVTYPGPRGQPGTVQTRSTRILDFLMNTRGIEARRLVTLVGPARDELMVELWICPEGATPPVP